MISVIINKNKVSKKRGFTILFASIIGSLVLQIGLAILEVTLMQINLASAGKDTQHAFYAADSGMECALFLNAGSGNGTYCEFGVFPKPIDGGGVCYNDENGGTAFVHKCAGQALTFEDDSYGSEDVIKFEVTAPVPNTEDACYLVTIRKSNTATKIQSRGYSSCDTDKVRFERAIETTF